MLMRETHNTIAHANKKANGVADALVKLAKTSNVLYNWNEVPEVINRLEVNDVIEVLFNEISCSFFKKKTLILLN